MGAADFVVRWGDFSGGNYGSLDPSFAEKNTYSGLNVCRYNSGLIGPRAGLRAFGVNWGAFNGKHPVLGPYGFDVYREKLLVTMGDKTYRLPFTATQPVAATPYDAYTAPASGFVRFAQSDRVLYALVNGDLWKHADAGTVTKITLPGTVKLKNLVRWGYYLIGVDADHPYRLWHSTVDINGPQPDNWTINSYLDVGSNLGIETLRPIFNTLYVGKADGWWGVSGVLGEYATVRQRSIGNGPLDDRTATVTTDNRVLYWPKDSMPAWFTGERVFLDRDYQLSGYTTAFAGDTVVATPTGQRLIMVGERTTQDVSPPQSGMLLWDKEWSSHTFDIPIAAIACGDVRDAGDLPEGVVFMCQRPLVVGDDISIVSFQTDPNRPGHAADAWAAPMDQGSSELVTGTLELPAHWEPQGRYMKVSNIIVQFRKWASGIANTRNQMQVRVAPLGTYDGGTINTEVRLWSEDCDRADREGTDDSAVFTGEDIWGRGLQIQFPVLRGVAIRSVTIEVEVRKERT
jgi:hypothetical protein